MKKGNLLLILLLVTVVRLEAQVTAAKAVASEVLPSFQFGIKGGANLSQFTTSGTFNSDNRAGYLAGIWARIGALGINLQPEVYYSSKTATLVDNNNQVNTVQLHSIDVPVLFGYKVGALGFGARLQTGPMASFILDENQSFGTAVGNITHLNFKNQAYAWQFGAGIDIQKISIDLRYELGLSNLSNDGYNQKLNLYNVSLSYRLF